MTGTSVEPGTAVADQRALAEKRLHVASVRAAWLTFFGGLLVCLSLVYGGLRLRDIEAKRGALLEEVSAKTVELDRLANTEAALRQDVQKATAKVERLSNQQLELQQQLAQSQEAAQGATQQLTTIKQQLTQVRCALASSRSAIGAFHQRQYALAVKLYKEALTCDPGNAYLLNLEAYAEFKEGRLDEAIQSQRGSVKADPDYAWGYFDLARFLCAAGASGEAKQHIEKAIRLRPDLRAIMQGDGEFRRVCGKLVPAG